MPDMKESERIVNRHLARLLCELEDAGCPVIFRDAVKSRLMWLRGDLNEMKESNPNDRRDPRS